ncbi:efflux RND transporter periplasmic adaptor subunit [Oceanospirillum sanctuarii]|uniref:efflux RND transporter periplasmic adaptor subunit n=1 Tax=Oceanospirillum sanctuarii TaxID=1434821 RepID=UPI000A363882|nr:efflux RND transporter periplasmic adaptor subunit [Oceanospirillum sanctuarii]
MTKRFIPVVTLLAGVIVGGSGVQYLLPQLHGISNAEAKVSDSGTVTTEKAADEPLYWVAPMDPNYRRDKPGKSPMGMDLVPVYDDGNKDDAPGTVKISPAVENNLGVRTANVSFDNLVSRIHTVGTISPDEESQWQLNSRVSGWIEKLYVKAAGEPVKKGQPLFRLYSPELVKAQDELIGALRLSNGQAMVAAAKRRLKALGMNDAQIAQVANQRQSMQEVTFYARQEGYLSQLNIREGAFISPATSLLEVVSLDSVWLKAELFESQAGLVNVGDSARITLEAFPDQEWQGEVDFIYPELNGESRTLVVRLKIPNPGQTLRPNMFARVEMQSAAEAPTLLIPREALIRSGTLDRVVVALGDGRFRSVKVYAGRENGAQVEILDGLLPGQKVVTSAQFLLDSESSLTADLSRLAFSQQTDHSGMDHSAMGHGSMNHEGMDHSQMGHGSMNHEGMNHEGMDHSAMGHGAMNHEGMNHEGMNHQGMNHEGMDHSAMGHGAMNHEGMNHEGMNHQGMNHEGMDHSQMGHGAMGTPAPLPAPTKDDEDLDWLDLEEDL